MKGWDNVRINFWDELSSSFGSQTFYQRQLKYFRWKHGIDTFNFKYSEMSEEEFREWQDITNREWINLKKWESSTKYKRLEFLYKEDQFATDLLNTYDKVKELANDGDSQAIKNMLLLQDEIREYRKSIDRFEQKQEEQDSDDGLII